MNVESERCRYLDVLRGVAILGILPANIPFFALPVMAEPSKGFAYHLTRFVFDYKFITLFSLLFGIGISILFRRAEATGRPAGRILVRRLLALWLFGVAHAVLLWYGDIVAYYGLLGLLVLGASRWRPRTLGLAGVVVLSLPIAGLASMAYVFDAYGDAPPVSAIRAALEAPAPEPSPPGAATGSFEEFAAGLETFDAGFETEVYREGSYGRITIVRTLTWAVGTVKMGWYLSFRIVGLFLVGMALGKTSWLYAPDRPTLRRIVAVGLVLGVPIQAAGSIVDATGQDDLTAGFVAELAQYGGSFGLSAAYAALVALAVAGGTVPRVLRPFEAIGRTAFTNYLFQSLACTTIFYAYGLALFGRLDREQLLLVVPIVWAVQLVLSPLWLSAFAMGPVEWLWRSITYLRLQPLRRKS